MNHKAYKLPNKNPTAIPQEIKEIPNFTASEVTIISLLSTAGASSSSSLQLQEEYRGDFFFYRVTFIIGPRCDRVSLAFQ